MQATRSEIEAARDRVLAEWRIETEPSALQRFLDWLFGSFSAPEVGGASLAARWILTLLVVALVAYLLARVVRRLGPRSRTAGGIDPALDVRVRVSELIERARAATERGELSLALRLFVFALLLGLGERGDLRFRSSWTNRELLRRGRPGPEALRVLQPIVDELEPKEFGREPTTLEDVRRLEEACARMLESVA